MPVKEGLEMLETRRFNFAHTVTSSTFSKDLAHRVNDYFRARQISRHANPEMVFKTVLGFVLWIATYIWLMTGRFNWLEVVGIYVIHGYTQLFMGLNIAHDANHGAYSKNKTINKALGRVFDCVGLSSYMWRLMHNDAHHTFVNVRGADTALISGRIFRFTPHDTRRPLHRYQHLYAPFLYCLATLDWVLVKDYKWLLSARQYGNRKVLRHPWGEVIFLFAAKAFYYTYMLVLPLIFIHAPWYSVLLGFTVMHFFLGFTLALTFQPNHFTEDSSYAEIDANGNIGSDYVQHIFDTTADYARGNPLACWMMGGLNLHMIHHMFPGICHVHYPALTEIIKSTAEDHGLHYRENRTISGAFLSHLKWMRILGRADFGSAELRDFHQDQEPPVAASR
jgi:linoleoyl-CoA desaturase